MGQPQPRPQFQESNQHVLPLESAKTAEIIKLEPSKQPILQLSGIAEATFGYAQDLLPEVLCKMPDDKSLSGVEAHLLPLSHEKRITFLHSLKSVSSLLRARSLALMAQLESRDGYKEPAIAHYQDVINTPDEAKLEAIELSELGAYYLNRGEELFNNGQLEGAREKFVVAYRLYKRLTESTPQNFYDNNRLMNDASYRIQQIAKKFLKQEDNYGVNPLGVSPLGYGDAYASEARH